MRRIFFRKEMATATLDGRKRATTRDHQKDLGEHEACTGSWRFPKTVKPFAVINITSNDENTWAHSLENFKAEGFLSLTQMLQWCRDNDLDGYESAPHLYYHEFDLVRKL